MGIDNKTYAAAKTYANKVALGFQSVTQTSTGFTITFKDGSTATYNVQNMHEHANKNILDLLTKDANGNLLFDGKEIIPDFLETSGLGSKFLADDGTYKSIAVSGGYDDTEVRQKIADNKTSIETIKTEIDNLQPKEDIALTTTDKTIVGAINEVKTNVDDLDTELGIKGVEEVLEGYQSCSSTDDGALEVVSDSVTPTSGQIKQSDASAFGLQFQIGEYVKYVSPVTGVDATGLYKYADEEINRKVGEIENFIGDSSALPESDSTIIESINRIDASLQSGLSGDQVTKLEAAYEHSQTTHVSADDIPTKVSDLTNDTGFVTSDIISDTTLATNKTYSNSKVNNLITQNLQDSKDYTDSLVSGLTKLEALEVTEEPTLENTTDKLNTILLYSANNDTNYMQYLRITDKLINLGPTTINLDGMYTKEESDNRFVNKTDYETLVGDTPLSTSAQTLTSGINELNEGKLDIDQGTALSGNLMTVGTNGLINGNTPFIESFVASDVLLQGDKSDGAIQSASLYVIGGQIALLTGFFYVKPTITAGWNTLAKFSTSWKYKTKTGCYGKGAASGYNGTDKIRIHSYFQVDTSSILAHFIEADTQITVKTGLHFNMWFPVQLR